jgi:hypothetical protein
MHGGPAGFAETLDFRRISCYMIAIEADALSHPQPVTNDRFAAPRISSTASFGADAAFDPD